MESDYLNKKYFNITDLIQTEFDRNVSKYGDKIKCSKGCSKCCSQIFKITQIDAIIIADYLNKLSNENKTRLKEKAIIYLNELSVQFPKENNSLDEYSVKSKLPCPALNGVGECMIYEARPVICRRFGPPVYDYKNPEKLFACELNFKDGEEIIDDLLIPLQTEIGMMWDDLKRIFNEEYDEKKIASTTIAEAILKS